MNIKLLILVFFIASGYCFAQNQPADFKAWRLMSYSGTVGIRGFYREQERVLNNLEDFSRFPFLYGGIALNTQSYIGHPNLLVLDIGGEFNPGLSKQTYTVSPDRSEVLTFKKLDVRATLFRNKPMSLSSYLNLSQNFINREYVTSLKTDTRQWGINYHYRNKFLPITVSYSDRVWDQLELETGRIYQNKQSDFQARASKSFTNLGDFHEVRFWRYKYFRQDRSSIPINNLNYNLLINNTFYFDSQKKYMLRSSITNLNQEGNINQKRFQMFESVHLRLPYKLRFSGNYDFNNIRQQAQQYKQHRIKARLNHELFSSLKTGVYFENFKTIHTAYDETNIRAGASLNYTKKIPTGILSLIYTFNKHSQNVVSNPGSTVQIIDENQVLADGQIVLLNRPYVNVNTIVVKDPTGSIIYQKDFDYFIQERNEFIEISRVPGGQIANNSAVLIDYVAAQVGSYNFDANMQSLTARVTLLDRLVEVYYTISTQDYSNIESGEFLTLNFYTRNFYGGRIQYKFMNAGVERDDYNSTIVPYKKMRYYLQMNGKIGEKTLLSLNGDLSDINLIETDTDQLFSSLYGKIIYQFKPQTKLNFDLGYRKQIGEQIDLDLITAKIEYNTVYRNLYMKVGLEVYRRNYVGEQLNFRGIYFQIDRKF